MVPAVMLPPAQVEAVVQRSLVSLAIHVVQQDGTGAVAKVGKRDGCERGATPKLSAHHLSIVHVPVVITHRAPDAVVGDLYATLATAVSIHHADTGLL